MRMSHMLCIPCTYRSSAVGARAAARSACSTSSSSDTWSRRASHSALERPWEAGATSTVATGGVGAVAGLVELGVETGEEDEEEEAWVVGEGRETRCG